MLKSSMKEALDKRQEVTQRALFTKLLCLSCSLLLAREVEPSRACIQRRHALTTVKSWRDRQPDYPAKK